MFEPDSDLVEDLVNIMADNSHLKAVLSEAKPDLAESPLHTRSKRAPDEDLAGVLWVLSV